MSRRVLRLILRLMSETILEPRGAVGAIRLLDGLRVKVNDQSCMGELVRSLIFLH